MNRKLILALVFLLFLLGAGVIMVMNRDDKTSSEDIAAAKEQYESQILDIPGVILVGESECDGEPCLYIGVTLKTPELESQITEQIEGVPFTIEEVGDIQIQPQE
jgi:fructose-1,6-bisphosphatase/sedoheptulose 1,7-bisphosphatase-like protein